jgi:arginyl-tRNA synthetase
MPLAKQLGKAPREIAAQITQRVDLADLCEPPEIAGAGFINLRLKEDWLVQQLEESRRDPRLGVSPVKHPRTYVIDFSSPNVAKPMHVGHIRSTVIGHAICRLLRFAGHRVISDNHLGDWGTQFGMIIYGFRHFADMTAYRERPVEELARVYQLVRELMDVQEGEERRGQVEEQVAQHRENLAALRAAGPTAGDGSQAKREAKALARAETQLAEATGQLEQLRARRAAAMADPYIADLLRQYPDVTGAVLAETARLHAGDPEVRRLWEEFLPKCNTEIERIYARLGISFDYQLGESFYQERLGEVVARLRQSGLAQESQGAVCVFLDGFDTPMIVQKQDGAYLYATTDLATIQYRMETWRPDAILYVVDFRQSEHFAKLFEVARRWGYRDVELEHVSFGTVLGEDGRPFKTRSGQTVGLESLLDEAEHRAYQIVCANDEAKPGGPELSQSERRHIAKVVGIAALKYADLSQNRSSDYVFSYDKMLALTGNTATYMQYSYARVHGIFQRGGVDVDNLRQSSARIVIEHPAERALALQLVRLSEAVDESLVDYRPNHLTAYLFELAKSFSTFFEQCPVLRADTAPSRDSRLLLCDLVARTLKQGLELLGINVVPKM